MLYGKRKKGKRATRRSRCRLSIVDALFLARAFVAWCPDVLVKRQVYHRLDSINRTWDRLFPVFPLPVEAGSGKSPALKCRAAARICLICRRSTPPRAVNRSLSSQWEWFYLLLNSLSCQIQVPDRALSTATSISDLPAVASIVDGRIGITEHCFVKNQERGSYVQLLRTINIVELWKRLKVRSLYSHLQCFSFHLLAIIL